MFIQQRSLHSGAVTVCQAMGRVSSLAGHFLLPLFWGCTSKVPAGQLAVLKPVCVTQHCKLPVCLIESSARRLTRCHCWISSMPARCTWRPRAGALTDC